MSTNRRQQLESFYQILQNLDDFAIFTMNSAGRITTWNSGARKIFGYDEDEIIGEPLARIFAPSDEQQAEWEMRTAERDGRADDERWHIRKNNELFWASGVLSTIREEDRKLKGYVKVLRDLAERKRAEEQRELLLRELRQSNEAKDRFLSTLSHELRTPLATIVGWSSLLLNGKLKPEQKPTAVESIYRNAQIQTGMIEDLLDMSRINAGQFTLERATLDLPQTARAAIDSIRFMATAKRIEIEAEIEETTQPVLADARRMQQILSNLLSNAVKFTPSAGRVSLRLRQYPSSVVIQISDTGQGMNPEFLPYAFDPFRQEQNTTTRSYGGMGLGLAIVSELVRLHGGSVMAASEGRGRGSTFTVSLPVRSAETHFRSVAQTRTATTLTGRRVLILENDPDCREFLRLAIEGYGGITQVAVTVREALDQIPTFKPDVVLVDIALPGEDGFVFLKKLRSSEDSAIRNIPAIAVTALATDNVRERALAEGFQAFIIKPLPADDLIKGIAMGMGLGDVEEVA